MKVSCDVIRDLLPLYTDQAASADTVALVEEHLASCPACREELGRLGTALPAEPGGGGALRRFKRRWRRRQVLIAVTAAVVTAAEAGGIFLTCFWGRRVAAGMWRSLWNCKVRPHFRGGFRRRREPGRAGTGELERRDTCLLIA